jgi:hypothetical protein
MGTALASFVTGLLIVFTQFDQNQVTKVDELQGAVRQIEAQALAWDRYEDAFIADENILLTLQTAVDKAIVYAEELLRYLEEKSEDSSNDAEHYASLMEDIAHVEHMLETLRTGTNRLDLNPGALIEESKAIEEATVPLMLQAPRTLLTMRVVEIGLPLLLSLISFFFALRYSLSEERCYEIKAALKVRNEKRLSTARAPD